MSIDWITPPHGDANEIDDCWNRLGIYGEGSCPLLPRHIHCRNCSVYSQAATAILDRFSSQALATDGNAVNRQDTDSVNGPSRSYVVFRHGDDWLGLPTRLFQEIAELQAIHSLPHQTASRPLLGVTNVRGRLVPCFSLAALLGQPAATEGPTTPCLLVIDHQSLPTALLVDAVLGVERIPESARQTPPATLRRDDEPLTEAVANWRDRRIALLDVDRLHQALNRGLH
ncbi:chemotaxis protein CheW [Crenobacter sp. SG2303]|uniref:Chemotaxis protein CheW n=1 Tax=Crenobacter oryzisoli TaxID=3056844 RepID=A0ABT7XTD5_9NEIS|nr:chemotaxis protein CheW [Crenobacter sp. SG2303]MDN0076988.1 chemotaxis protein CheW [Crenobacter sp. SG2303]